MEAQLSTPTPAGNGTGPTPDASPDLVSVLDRMIDRLQIDVARETLGALERFLVHRSPRCALEGRCRCGLDEVRAVLLLPVTPES